MLRALMRRDEKQQPLFALRERIWLATISCRMQEMHIAASYVVIPLMRRLTSCVYQASCGLSAVPEYREGSCDITR